MTAHPEPSSTAGAPAGDAASFARWCEAAHAIRGTTKRLGKLAVLAEYLPTLDDAALPVAARFFAGIVFPRHDMRTTQVGGALLHDAIAAVSGRDREALSERYVALGDSGDLAADALAGRAGGTMTLADVGDACATLAATTGTKARRALLVALLARCGEREAQYLVKLLGGELRVGLKEAQVEEAVARLAGVPLAEVRRANLLRGDIGDVALLARHGRLGQATLALFHPIGFMLAQPLPTAGEIVAAMPSPFVVEDKYDGIRAQAHVEGERVALFSRTLDEITHGYPEVAGALRTLGIAAGRGIVLDGELLAVDPADPRRALPFLRMQQRLGRKTVDERLRAEVPVWFVAYDLIAHDGALVVDEPWRARRERLRALRWPAAHVRLAEAREARTAEEVEAAFAAARAAGNEGLIAKDPSSPYAPGRRGKAWIKLKKAEETLDVVVVGAEWGHGRRRSVLSDYTFAVRRSEEDPTLLTVGKAYNGLTDLEIVALTKRLEAITLETFGRYRTVRPEIVLEVTFDLVQKSARHKSGYALRFPRILRVRDDKPASEVDTLERVRALAGEAEEAAAGEAAEESS